MDVSPGRSLCRSYPEGGEAFRASRHAADELRTGHQSEDREGAQYHDPAVAAGSRGRGDRVAFEPASMPDDSSISEWTYAVWLQQYFPKEEYRCIVSAARALRHWSLSLLLLRFTRLSQSAPK